MKKIIVSILLLAVPSLYGEAQTKRALIIAIGDYPDPDENG